MLVVDRRLPWCYHDHALTGEWKDYRDCHVRPDLVLIYRNPDAEHLDLVRLGSHSELGLWASTLLPEAARKKRST